MQDTQGLGKLDIEYAIDETIPGRHPKCAACQKILYADDERIVLRKEQANVQGIREGMFFCFSCSLELTRTITRLLGYGK